MAQAGNRAAPICMSSDIGSCPARSIAISGRCC
jgi:hypothetical protein